MEQNYDSLILSIIASPASATCKKLTLTAETSKNELNYSSESTACTNSDNAPDGHQHKPGLPTHTHYAATNTGASTFFPPVIVALLNRGVFGPDIKPYSPKNEYQPHQSDKDPGFGGWRQYKKHKWNKDYSGCNTGEEDKPENLIDNWFCHLFDILMRITLASDDYVLFSMQLVGDFLIVCIDIGVAIIISFVAAVLWTLAYGVYRDTKTKVITYPKGTGTTVAVTIGTPGADVTCNPAKGTLKITGGGGKNAKDGEGPSLTLNLKATKDPKDTGTLLTLDTPDSPANVNYTEDKNTLKIKYTQDGTDKKCIEIEIKDIKKEPAVVPYGHIFTGMIVPFYLIDKIETVLLVPTTFPPVIIAILQKLDDTKGWSPKTTIRKDPPNGVGGWTKYNHRYTSTEYGTRFYHGFDLLMIIKMTLIVLYILFVLQTNK